MKLEKRIRELEARLLANQVTLYFADGSARQIRGDGNYLLDLLISACRRDQLSCGHAADLDLIRECVGSKEANGGHMVELIRCFMLEPIGEPSSDTRPEG